MIAKLFSIAKVSNWCLYYPERLLFDCGEGISEKLANDIYCVERIFISHGHWDHIGGLVGFIYSRMSNKGSNDKPLDIYCHEGIVEKINTLVRMANPDFRVSVIPICNRDFINGETIIPLRDNYAVKAFTVSHSPGMVCLGYSVICYRQRLNKSGKEFLAKCEKENTRFIPTAYMYEKYTHAELVYLLDSGNYDRRHIENADLVIFDATFVDAADKERNSHCTWDECISDAQKHNVTKFVLAHNSRRYNGFTKHVNNKHLNNNNRFLGMTHPFATTPVIINKLSKENYTFTSK